MRQALLLSLLLPAVALSAAPKQKPRAIAKLMKALLNPWVGHSAAEVMAQFGTPTDAYPNEHYLVLIWEEGRKAEDCRYWFEMDRTKTIRHWHWEGKCSGTTLKTTEPEPLPASGGTPPAPEEGPPSEDGLPRAA